MKFQAGGFALGLVVGLLMGLALALGVALYITKAPVPFLNKVPQRTVEQDKAEAERNKNWDPNAPLAPKLPRPVLAAYTGAEIAGADLSLLTAPTEAALMLKLADYPTMLSRAAAELARARMALLSATRQVLRNGLAVLGVGAPDRMAREQPETEAA